MEVTHWVLHQGWCLACGCWTQAQVPAEHAMAMVPGSVPALGNSPGHTGTAAVSSKRFVARCCVPISLGAIQKVLDRVTQAIDPYYAVIARQAQQAPVNYMDETPWYCLNTLEWLWVMASERVDLYMIPSASLQRGLRRPPSTTRKGAWRGRDGYFNLSMQHSVDDPANLRGPSHPYCPRAWRSVYNTSS